MKYLITPILFCLFAFSSCKKEIKGENLSTANSLTSPDASSKGSSGGGGGTATTGPISFVGGVFKLIGGNSDSIQINLTQAAPAGWVLSLSSNDAAFQVPASFPVPQGALYVHIPVTSSVITVTKKIVITAQLLGQTVNSFPFEIFPLHYNFSAPLLQSPGNGSGFRNRIQVKFTWSDDVNAYYHDIQISDDPNFTNTPMLEVYLDGPIWAASYFNGLGRRYWRVRYIDGSGTPGPWSAVRNFEIKQ